MATGPSATKMSAWDFGADIDDRKATWVVTEGPQWSSKTSASERSSGEREWLTSRDSQGTDSGELRQRTRLARPIASIRAKRPATNFKA